MNERKVYFLKTALRVITIQFKTTPWHTITNILIGAIHAYLLTLGVIFTQRLFDVITQAAAGEMVFRDCKTPLFLLAAAKFGHQIMKGINAVHDDALNSILISKNRTLLHRKIQHVDAALFEDTVFLDNLNLAQKGVDAIPSFCVTIFTLVGFYAVYIVSMGMYLFSLKPVLLVIIVIAYLPAMLAQTVRGKMYTRLEVQSAPLRREQDYYYNALCSREYFKETRILGAFQYFHKLFSDTMKQLTSMSWKVERNAALLELMLSIATFAGMAVSVLMLFRATMSGEITIGAFAAVFGGLNSIFTIIGEIVNKQIGNMTQNIGKIANFVHVLEAPEKQGIEGKIDFSKGIVAKDVSFTYPGRDKPAVKNVSINIAETETIAIVGENGAGKSTLVRLLTGVYYPTKGNVTVGGLDTIETSPFSIYRGISGVFQKYQRYKMTLEVNVTISNTDISTDPIRMETALQDANFTYEIPRNIMLSPEFDGIDLSGGQWQRLAIARGLYRDSGFIILDEPTAAIDPIEETRIFAKFKQLVEGKCAIIVTHRLGSAKLANRIIVMDGGEIVDTGTHEELLARPGKYAVMWKAQAQWYQRSDTSLDDV